jgi:Ni/Co efflux regulator RcnB
MRKLMIAALAATVLVPSGAYAQSAREVRHDQREVNRDLANGRYNEAREDQNELREDWRAYRRTHRSVYDRPIYRAPRGYTYNPLGVGALLDSAFWSPRYRISNYSHYRLPYPGRHRAWVRYGNDVVLINVRTGRIVQVYNNFYY